MSDVMPWWTLPRTVVWVATRSEDLAEEAERLGRPALDAATLEMKLLHLCGPVAAVPLAPNAGVRAQRAAMRQLKRQLASRPSSPYEVAQKCLLDALRIGLPSQGSRSPDETLEMIPGVEWQKLSLSGFDASNRRTGNIIWHDVQVDAEIARKLWPTVEELAKGSEPEAQPATVIALDDVVSIAGLSRPDPPGPKPGNRDPLKRVAPTIAERIFSSTTIELVHGWRSRVIRLVSEDLRKLGYQYTEGAVRKDLKSTFDQWESRVSGR